MVLIDEANGFRVVTYGWLLRLRLISLSIVLSLFHYYQIILSRTITHTCTAKQTVTAILGGKNDLLCVCFTMHHPHLVD